MEIKLQSVITCPNCGYKKEETMPTDACQYFYECEKCKQVLKPKQGDCCVYCSYGTVPCPPIQQDKKCCWQTGSNLVRENADFSGYLINNWICFGENKWQWLN